MPPEGTPQFFSSSTIFPNSHSGIAGLSDDGVAGNQRPDHAEAEVLVDNKGRPYNLGPKGFVCDLNTRAVKIARRVQAQALAAAEKEPNGHVSKGVRIVTYCPHILTDCTVQ